MTTASSDSLLQHTNDADFRVWAQQFEALLVAAGLVVTSDTGQVDLTTMTKPVGGIAGYRMYRFNDALQATAPIYIRVGFGTSTLNSGAPQMNVQVGTGTNGANSLLAGAVTGVFLMNPSSAPLGSGTPFKSKACVVEGCAWISFKYNYSGTNSCQLGFLVARSCDSAGNPTSHGFLLVSDLQSATTRYQQVLLDGPTVSASSQSLTCMIPSSYVSSVVGTDVQFWKHYMAVPRSRCVPYLLCCNYTVDTPYETQRSLTVIGGTARNYICIGKGLGTGGAGLSLTGTMIGLMLIWE